jgi:hypothetical protein
MTAFTSSCTSYTFTYTSTQNSGSALPSFLTFSATSKTYTVYTTDTTKIGTYTIKLLGTLNDASATSAYITWKLVISAASFVVSANTAPTFSGSLVDQTVNAGSSGSYTLPGTTDADGDNVAITAKLGKAATFVTYSSGKFTISPGASLASGAYTVTVTLTDDNASPKSTSYTFNINVKGKETAEASSDSTDSDSTFDSGLGEGSGDSSSSGGNSKPTIGSGSDSSADSKTLKASIEEISNLGVVTV